MWAYRLIKVKYDSNPLDPSGAKNYGGRWNSKGTPVIYASDSISLSALELLAHLHQPEILNNYTLVSIHLPDEQVTSLDNNSLPNNWRDDPSPLSTALIGDEWIHRKISLGLLVPSTIVPQQNNVLINPLHSGFIKLTNKITVELFNLDSRLLKK